MAETKPTVQSSNPASQFVDGFQIPAIFSAENFRSAVNYKPRDDDVFIVTYPKCGTTWTQHILLLIFRQGQPTLNNLEFFKAAPFMEIGGAESAEKMPRPGAIKVHLPYHLTPRSDKAKYIYITRNPKDCCVSYYYHMKDMPLHGFNETFDDFFELFISGNTDYGDYFDHLLGWYEHRNDPNVLFMTYEEMKENTEAAVLKMASFIGDKLYAEPLRNDPEKLGNIIKYSSIKHMKETVNKGMDEMHSMSAEDIMNSELPEPMKNMFAVFMEAKKNSHQTQNSPSNFVRKGIIGDWKNHFNDDQNRRMNEKFAERTKGTDIPTWWNKYM